ncbi:extracellular solute-binding protein [Candidatus Phycosocius spiralis]|uniref:Iron deficiency-induced protein A n=1 Tax=Candidatus Phycosocius spiralis TaxID=2815099 RepID=A0ABQ4PY69_9PROT|nr:extracellular solute-binding protein [Candidatus Phycosocius spiralis]GIU67881.1 iron deficiency-induced protein A [Candidatus Phycosocius spiralis]
MMRTILKKSCPPLSTCALMAMLALFSVTACGPSEQEKNSKGVVNIYSARHYDADEELYDLFKKTTGIEVKRIEMKGDLLLERLKAEGNQSPADVILLVDAGNFWRAQSAGLFQPVQSAKLDASVPKNLQGANKDWFGFTKRARVIAYDPSRIKPEQVATYSQLTDPSLKGQICVRPSSNVYNLSMMSGFIQEWGVAKAETWAKGVVANFARPPEGADTDQLKAIAQGQCAISLVNHYYAVRLQRSLDPAEKAIAAKIALSFPDQKGEGTHVNVSGGALARYAPNKANGITFLEFLVSPPAQAIFAKANDEFPILTSAMDDNSALKGLAGFKEAQTPMTVLGINQGEAQKVFDRAGWK